MRALIVALFALIVSFSPVSAHGPCTSLKPMRNVADKYAEEHFAAVYVSFEIPYKDGEHRNTESKAFVRFWIRGGVTGIVRGGDVVSVHACHFPDAEKAYWTVRAFVENDWKTEDSYFLSSRIVVPKRLVDAEPAVGSETPFGTPLVGKWGKGKRKGVEVTTLELFPKTSGSND